MMAAPAPRNLVMGLCTGYGFDVIEAFVASLFHHVENVDLCLFSRDMDAAFGRAVARFGILLRDPGPYLTAGVHPMIGRFRMFRDFLEEHGQDYGQVLLTDVRDVLFQDDPFAIPRPREVSFAAEDVLIGANELNAMWVRAVAGDAVLREIGHCVVSCAGTTIGSTAGIRAYLDQMCALFDQMGFDQARNYDQGVHNVLVSRIQPEWGVLDTDDRIVGTVGCTSADRVAIVEGAILVDGRRPAVVHQWDRHRDMVKLTETDPRFRVHPTLRPLSRRALDDIFSAPAGDQARGMASGIATGEAVEVALPPLRLGARMLSQLPPQSVPGNLAWADARFRSVTPWVCAFSDVLVHGDGGIVAGRGFVVEDTMLHVVSERQGWVEHGGGVMLMAQGEPERLGGTWLSLLCGSHWNHYHWLLDGIGRLAAVDAATMAQVDGILVPEGLGPVAEEALALSGITRWREVRTVGPQQTLAVDRLLVPWRMADGFWPHPDLQRFLDGLVPEMPYNPDFPARIWIDRRGATNRPLANEAELIGFLEGAGVVPVQLETMTLVEQAGLFRQAELVVAPHGAGLANLVFGRAPCAVIELVMDRYQHWGFRRLAALAGLDYDCVVGQALPGQTAGWEHDLRWAVAPAHLHAALAAVLAAPRAG
jgi:capsular polysaccharide biosynthesis protein